MIELNLFTVGFAALVAVIALSQGDFVIAAAAALLLIAALRMLGEHN